MTASGSVNAAAWIAWFAAVATVPLVTRNPLYLALALVCAFAVYLSVPRRDGAARAWRLVLILGSSLTLVSVAFNVLTVHVGDRPFARLPDGIPIVGGPLTLNALAYGLLSAAAITTLLVAAAAFNSAVRQGDLIRLLPGAFAGLGVAGSVAVTAIPGTIAAARDIYDAQRARGRRLRSARDARDMLVPLLGTSMERALTLSEALEARGFGASSVDAPPSPGRRTRLAIALPVACLLASLALLGAGQLGAGLAALLAAVALALALAPRRSRRTRYRALRWDRASTVVATCAALSAMSLLVALSRGASLRYDTFPRLVAPPFDPLLGAALLLLLAPALWSRP